MQPLQVFGCSQTDRWFWQWCSLLKGHITRIWSQWSDCLLAAAYKKVKLKHAGDDWRKRENPSVLMNGLYPGWLYGLSSSWRSLRMQLSAGLEPPRRDKLGLCLAQKSDDCFCHPFQGHAASTPGQHNMNLLQKRKTHLAWPDSLDLLLECCWDMQTWEWQNKQKAAKSTRGVKSAKYLTTSLHTCKWEAASCTLPQLVSWHLRGNDCCHLGRQKPWNELITQGCAALGLLHCKLESKGF